MEKSGKITVVVIIVVILLLCLCIGGILAAIGIPAYFSAGETTTTSQPKTETNTFNASAEEWNSTVDDASGKASDLHLSLTDVALTRVDVVYALLNGDKKTLIKTAGDFSSQMAELEKLLVDSQNLNDKRAAIVKDLKASVEGSTSNALKKSYVDKAAETVDQEKALLDEYAKVLELLKGEQDWFDKGLAGTADVAVIRAAIDKSGAQITDDLTVIGEMKITFTPQGAIPVD